MSVVKFLIEKEFKQIFRNGLLPKLIVGYPIMALLIFPWAISFEVKNIRVNVVDYNKNVYSQRLIQKINTSTYFILNDISTDYDTAFNDIRDGKCDMVLEIPANFDKELIKDGHSSVFIAANAVNGTQGLLGSNYLTRIIGDFSSELAAENPRSSSFSAPRVEIVPNYRFNPELDYKSFMIPAFIAMIITLICGILPALNIVIEKETGTIQQINATPVNKFSFIIAKLIPYWIIGLFIITVSLFLVWGIYGLFPTGNPLLIYLAVVVYIIAISGLGIIISNYSNTLQQAMFLVMFMILIIILLSGLFTPISGMPRWAQIIAYCNPLSYAAEIMRMIYLKGAYFSDMLKPLIGLSVFAVGLNTWAVLSYKKRS